MPTSSLARPTHRRLLTAGEVGTWLAGALRKMRFLLGFIRTGHFSKLNLAVVGNIRPDWFLDSRGDDTDVQYLGDQHVFYDTSLPKLVKQWRKKDFASQYFGVLYPSCLCPAYIFSNKIFLVMSMRGNPPNYLAKDPDAPEIDDMHLPLILNIPGEGFGDDSIQVYRNHALLVSAFGPATPDFSSLTNFALWHGIRMTMMMICSSLLRISRLSVACASTPVTLREVVLARPRLASTSQATWRSILFRGSPTRLLSLLCGSTPKKFPQPWTRKLGLQVWPPRQSLKPASVSPSRLAWTRRQ